MPALRLCYITDRLALAAPPAINMPGDLTGDQTGAGDPIRGLVGNLIDLIGDLIGESIAAGVDLIQVREKDLETRSLVDLVERAVAAARGTETRIVVNDRLDVALALDAAGVHLGQQSMPAGAVREVIEKVGEKVGEKVIDRLGDRLGERLGRRDFLVGVSCHSLREAEEAQSSGASYVLLGPVFETPSKLRYGPPLGLEKLREVTARVKVPVLALGGITVERVKPCLEAGATGVAGISLFQNAPSVAARVRELRAQFGT